MTTATKQQPIDSEPGLLRIWHVVGDKKRGLEPILPISKSTFLAKVQSGEYPKPVNLGEKTTAWRKSDIMELLERFGGAQ